jgi:hypothetical protein
MNRKALMAFGVAAACSVVGFAALGGGSTVRNVAIANVRTQQGPMEVYGALDKRSIRAIRSSNLVAFDIVDDKTKQRLSVLYDNPSTGLPVNFPTASHVRATGVYDSTQDKLVSDKVYTKCPSKDPTNGKQKWVYGENQKQDTDTEEALIKWQTATGQKTGQKPSGT